MNKEMGEHILKRMLSVCLAAMLLFAGLSASAMEIPDFNTWLSDYVGDAQYSTTQSFLNTLNEYDVPYTFLGKIADGEEYVTIDNNDTENNLSYTFNVSFSQDLSSARITVFDLLTFEPDEYSIARDICKAIYADYGTLLFVPIEASNTISLAYTVDLSECEDVGIQVLAVIINISKIVTKEYSRFASIIDNGGEIKNTSTPQPTGTPEPTPTPTPRPTATPEPTNTPNSTKVPNSVILAEAERLYNSISNLWPTDFDLAKSAGVHSVRNIQVSSCEIGDSRSSTFPTVLFKGNFSGYDEYGMFVSRYTFTAEVTCTIYDGSIIDIDFTGAEFRTQKA